MSTTNVPVTLNLLLSVPEGVTLASQGEGQEPFQFTVAAGEGNGAAFQPRITPDVAAQSNGAESEIARLKHQVERLKAALTRVSGQLAKARKRTPHDVFTTPQNSVDPTIETHAEEIASPAAQELTRASQAKVEQFKATAPRPKPKPIPNYPDDTSDPDVTAGFADPTLNYYPHITARQLKAMLALMMGQTVTGAAIEAEVSNSTVHRWLRKPEFREHFAYLQRQEVDCVRSQLHSGCHYAAEVVIEHVYTGRFDHAFKLLKGMGYLNGKQQHVPFHLNHEPLPVAAPQSPPLPQRESLNGHACATNGQA